MYGFSGLILTPAEGSPSITGANFDPVNFNNFFKVTYNGAIGADNQAVPGNWAAWK